MIKIRPAVFLVIITSTIANFAISDTITEHKQKNSSQDKASSYLDAKEQGKSMHQEIDEWRKHQSQDPNKASAEVELTIQKYIRAGISFDSAESILKEAGFEISRHLDAVRHPKLDYRDDVVGSLVLKEKFPSMQTLTVSLSPRAMGDYLKVEIVNIKVSVEIL